MNQWNEINSDLTSDYSLSNNLLLRIPIENRSILMNYCLRHPMGFQRANSHSHSTLYNPFTD